MIQEQLTITTRDKLLKILVIFVLAVAITFCGSGYALADEAPPDAKNICAGEPSQLETQLRGQLGNKLLTYEGCPEEMGAWYMLPMPENKKDRMQAVHAALLPDKKVLIVNGSSNRNHVTAEGKIEDGVNTKNYDVVNNTSIFDPSFSDPYDNNSNLDFTKSPFERISSPLAEINNESNDPFCSGHLQMPNGDVLFIGGSRVYYPGVRFSGSKQANIFHWKEKSWENLGLTQDGHWYPTLIPLADGAIASFSGFTADPSQIVSTLVEIYDPNLKTWQSIDVKNLPNNPFVTRMNDESFGSDIIDLYARILPTKKKNQFLITGDGGGKNEPKIAHASTHSYFVTFNKDENGKYSISFEQGPDRLAINKVYGTAVLDPNSPNGDVLLMGGIMGTNNIGIGPGKDVIKGASIAASLERWKAPEDTSSQGSWEIDQNFFAKIDEDILLNTEDIVDGKVKKFPLNYKYVKQSSNLGRYGKRAMEQAVILPTKEILVVNGGNYAETRPAYNPTLLIPDPTKTDHQGFRTKLMNPDVEPRLYHNTALLLPDARVLVMGGNNSRAARYDVDGTVRLDTKNDFAFVDQGTEGNSGEIWQHAIFYPPYLFGSSDRPEIEAAPEKLQYGTSQSISVSNASIEQPGSIVLVKLGSVTHSFDNGQRLVDININNKQIKYLTAAEQKQGRLKYNAIIPFTVPTDDHFTPPGYYMMFYLNSAGKPSHSKMVQLVVNS
ncbi:galactose oxidase early set domain-containing protein [Nodularia spumigena CS-591/12]|nr:MULTISPECIES: galactose oxidase early set domain-containing protein [Cyanophyceae]MDB9306408.1 galactose oxidase early set domain-containing protein [Nodularia spumigena CS-591/12]MDB9317506.1 galactose oxidase early set domain-containing protein [Nodularia spumigena CS-590/01A]MDB9334791.1 galactose oxidase early set domain-containing protein [Nodularia spumigena CS-590/01]